MALTVGNTRPSFAAVLFTLITTLGAASIGPKPHPENSLPAGLTLVDWHQIQAEYHRHRHGMFPDANGGYHARTHKHGWLARFDGTGVSLTPDTQPWTWGLELVRWGRPGHEITPSAKPRIQTTVNRLEYNHNGITEWFVNGQDGLEHGFTIPTRPEGAAAELAIHLHLRGDLTPRPASNGQAINYETKQGAPALHYRKLIVTDARGRRLPARLAASEKSLQILLDDRQAIYPLTVDPVVQQAYLKASNTGATDRFANSVAISGDTVVLGTDQEDSNATGINGDQSNNTAANAGAAYVFVRSGGVWTQQAYLKASNTGAGDAFGVSVAIQGDTLVVGADREDSDATGVNATLGTGGCTDGDAACQPGTQSNNALTNAGAAYVFVRTGSTWTQQSYLKASNTGVNDAFGTSLTITGDTIVVGAPFEGSTATGINGSENDDCAPNAGAAYVFVRTAGTWSQQAYLKASNTGAVDIFGISVAISGETLVVGAWGEASNTTGVNGNETDDSSPGAGAAYVFVRSGTTWSQQAYLKASNAEGGDNFGFSVAISGDTVVVGARQEGSNATGVNGSQTSNDLPGSGAAYVFLRASGVWSQQAYLKPSNPDSGDNFGYSVAIDGDTVLIAARYEASDNTGINAPRGTGTCMPANAACEPGTQANNAAVESGALYLFQRISGNWNQQAYIKASNTGTGDRLRVVALSGNTILAGAWGEDSNATGVNAPSGTGVCAASDAACQPGTQANNALLDSGAAYVLRLVATSLAPATNTVPGTGATAQAAIVNAESWLPWTATTNAAWLTITAGTSGVGPGSVTYDCAPLTSINGRTGTLTIGGLTHTVTQNGLTGAVTLSPTSDTAPPAGATAKSVAVTSNATDFAWTATANVPWLSITTGATGLGNGAVTYDVASNATSVNTRSGTLTIGGQTLTVTQTGVTGAVTLSPTTDTAPGTGATGKTITVTANATDFAWTATANVPWLTITTGATGTGSGTITANAATNTSINSRTGVITVAGQTWTITQGGITGAVTLSPSTDTAPGTGATGKSVTVTSNATDFAWTATANVPWLTITTGATGLGTGAVTYDVAPLTSINSRTGAITIAGQTLTVTQSGLTGAVTLSPSTDTAPANGATGKSVTVTANATDFPWTATSNVPWLSITTGATGTGTAAVTYNVAASPSINSRTGVITVAGQTLTVIQSGVTGAVTLSPSTDTATAGGANGKSVTVTSNATDFPWTANANAPWITITAGATGLGTGAVTYNVASNATSVNSRTGTLTIGGQTLTITQGGVTGNVLLSPGSDAAPANGATGKSVTLTSNATDFVWTAVANVPWLTIATGASGTGSGAVTYNVTSNASSVNSRTGTLTIGGQTLTVTQSGVTGAITLSPASDAAPVNGATARSIAVTSNATDFAWTAASNAPWLTITSNPPGTGSGTVTYNIASNATSINSRTATLTIGGQSFAITQPGITGAINLSPASDTAPVNGANAKSITVTANATDFAWTSSSNVPWLTITAGATGTGNGAVTYNVASNATSVNSRTGALTIGGQTFVIAQPGVTGAINLAPASDTAPATGATAKSITVTSNATDFAWTATASVPWITITAGATGTGNGTVTCNVAPNPSSVNSRTGAILIAGQSWTITQSGVTGALTLSPASDTVPVGGANGRLLTVTANAPDFAWTAASNVPWITITTGATGTGNGAITYNVAANTGSEDRSGTLTIGGRTFAVSQQTKPELLLTPTRAAVSFITGEPVPPIVAELGGTPGLAFTVRSDVPWLQVSPRAGVLTGGLKLTITPSNQLSPGEYVGTITVQAERAEARTLLVRLSVTEPTQFIALPAAIELEGATPAQLYITSRGRQVSYRAEAISEGGWLSVSPEIGTTPVNLRVTANPYYLKPGRYTGAIRLTSAEPGGGGPISIPVTLNVPAQPQQP